MATLNQDKNKIIQDLKGELDVLLLDIKKTHQEIKEINKEVEDKVNAFSLSVDKSIKNINQVFAHMDQAEKDFNDEMQALVADVKP